jgi:hypothetical protein
MISCCILLSISLIGSLSYWRSQRQFKVSTNSITRYYSLHTEIASQAENYTKYLAEVDNKSEYFETLDRQRKFYENQQL